MKLALPLSPRLAAASLLVLMTSACASAPPAAPTVPALPASAPAPSASVPTPSASVPTPSASAPAPSVSTPAPSVSTPAPSASTPAAVDSLWQQIQAASANAPCDNSSQCHAIGIGAKACGGPESYLAWSSKQDDGAALKQLVAQHAAALRARDARDAIMSTCSVVSSPGASCQDHRCVLNPGRIGTAPEMR